MPHKFFIALAWGSILLVGLALRLDDLRERPMHADEATGAYLLATRLSGDTYIFNPKHFHGPILSWVTIPLAQYQGESNWQELTKHTLRLSPLIAGTLVILTPLLWWRQLQHKTALLAAAFLATSPLLIYYSRMYIHESWLLLFAMLTCATLFRLIQKPQRSIAVITGILIGLMYATKETFVISLLSWLIALTAHFATHRSSLRLRNYASPAILAVIAAAVTASFFYSDGFRSMKGILDAVRTYFVYETTPGHEKSFGYYFNMLVWPKHALGMWWTEGCVALFAIFAWLKHKTDDPVRFLAVSTLAHFLIYSLISYKTPWLMLVPWAHACLLAACIFQSAYKPGTSMFLMVLTIAGLGYQMQQSIHANGRFANDTRTPYAYVPTSKDIEKLDTWLIRLLADEKNPGIAVVGNGYWPLPWYLKNFKEITYLPEAQEVIQQKRIVFAMPEHTESSDALLENSHTKLPRGLRENVAATLYLQNELWENWTKSTTE